TPLLNGKPVISINANLTSGLNVNLARRLRANSGTAFEGVKPIGGFDAPEELVGQWIGLPNPDNASNEDVLKPFYQGKDIVNRPTGRWIVDFNQMSRVQAERYAAPFAYVEQRVRPMRANNLKSNRRDRWWQFGETNPGMRSALSGLPRYIATARHMKHRFFCWVQQGVLPGDALTVIASEDDYTLGIVHSYLHAAWASAQGTSLEDRPRYTPTTCFETFPFPEPTLEQMSRISAAAKHLDNVRSHLLAEDPKLTMTKLYNEVVELREQRDAAARAFPLLLAHEKLDELVAAAYGWEWPLDDEVILARLLGLNLQRAANEAGVITDQSTPTAD
ncbi:MAG TPA: type IIL restriction-modification enzyme MmeI, partial [Trueperaceae bacterium]|nr:type IIL restriction-modification enzyme MmeI [Trueperaceae bacterium]